MNITRGAINRPVLVGVCLILAMGLGIYSYFLLNYELVPKFNPPVITVVTIYPGATANQVEDEVTIPIEDALSSLGSVDIITSTSRDNFSLVKLELVAGIDVEALLNEANRKIIGTVRDLPAGAEYPVLTRFDFDDLPIIRLGVFADVDAQTLGDLCRDLVVPSISQIAGVADVRLLGSAQEEVQVIVAPNRLAATNTTILQVLQAIGTNNVQIPGGAIQGNSSQPVVFDANVRSIEELQELIIFEREEYGIQVRLRDVAQVRNALARPTIISRLDGEPSVGIDILKQGDANAVEVSAFVMAQLTKIEDQLSHLGLRFEVAQDTSEFTLKAANGVIEDLGLAVVLVSLVMILFLHSLRNAFIVFVSIPTSIVSTFIVMSLLGYSLNLLTLLGLSLAIGILVDDSIVVIENIHRHLMMGKKAEKAALDGRMEIGFAAISITLIDVVVFLPIVFTTGMVSDLLRQFSVVIISSTLMSLLVSFTLVPYLASRIHKKFKGDKQPIKPLEKVEQGLSHVANELALILTWSFKWKWVVFLSTSILLAGAGLLIPAGLIGVEFTKAGDRSEFIIELKSSNGTPLPEMDRLTRRAEEILLSYPFVQTVFTTVGTTSSGRISTNTENLAELFVRLVDREARDFPTSQFARHIKYQLIEEIPGLEARPIEINIIGLRDDDAVQVTVQGQNAEDVFEAGAHLAALLDSVPGTIEVQSSLHEGISTLQVTPSRQRAEALGISLVQAGQTVRVAINGHKEFRLAGEGKRIPINVQFESAAREDASDLGRMTLLNDKGQHVPLQQLASIEEEQAPDYLERTNRGRSVTIKSQVVGRPGGSVGRSFSNAIEQMDLNEGLTLIYGGATKRTREGLTSMIGAFVISIFLVYLILAALYNSFYYPLVVLFSIPLAVIGAFL
ncbi:MAG: efflux RND transporter permease subunit, partial [Bacteroidota bacterium]